MNINVPDLSDSAHLHYEDAEEDAGKINSTTHLILNEINHTFKDQPDQREEKIENFRTQQVQFIESLLNKEDIDSSEKLDYFLKIAQFCSNEHNTFSVRCIHDAITRSQPKALTDEQKAHYDKVLSELSTLTKSDTAKH